MVRSTDLVAPPALAEMVAVPVADVPALATKVALVAPAGTWTDGLTVTAGLLLDSATVTPPDGALAESATVQLELAPGLMVDGLHVRPETTGTLTELRMVTVPSTVAVGKAPPVGSTATACLTWTSTELLAVDGDIVTLTAASVPLPMTVELIPDARQVYVPTPPAQDRLLPAAVATGPAVTCTAETSAGEKMRVHCNPAG
jgi:hypothetical protein